MVRWGGGVVGGGWGVELRVSVDIVQICLASAYIPDLLVSAIWVSVTLSSSLLDPGALHP